MAALSPHSASGGTYSFTPRRSHRAAISRRSAVLADTPPAITSVFAPVSATARMVRSHNTSTTVCWNDAARSGSDTASPVCRAWLSWLSTAVFSPEKLKS